MYRAGLRGDGVRIETIGDATLLLGDCRERMAEIPDASVDMVLCDLPYAITACAWDSLIPFEPLWAHYWRVLKPRGTVALTAAQPFTTRLIASQIERFKYCWYWEKAKGPNFALTGFQPLKTVEEIAVFSRAASTFTKNGNAMTYNPQKVPLAKPYSRDNSQNANQPGFMQLRGSAFSGAREYTHATPRTLIYASTDGDGRVHPTQKPVALMEYLIRTYTHVGETVLDNTMGSGTTGAACINTGRGFIGIERDPAYFDIAVRRIEEAAKQGQLFAPERAKQVQEALV